MPKSRLARSKEKVASNTAAGGSSALCFNDVWELSVSVWLLVVVFVVSTLVCCVAGVLLWLELVDDGGMASHFGVHYHEDEHAEPPQQQSRLSAADLTRVLGFSRARLFAQLDRNWNGLLSLSEIEPLMQHARLDTQHPVSTVRSVVCVCHVFCTVCVVNTHNTDTWLICSIKMI